MGALDRYSAAPSACFIAASDPGRWQGTEQGLSSLKSMLSECSHGTEHQGQNSIRDKMKDMVKTEKYCKIIDSTRQQR